MNENVNVVVDEEVDFVEDEMVIEMPERKKGFFGKLGEKLVAHDEKVQAKKIAKEEAKEGKNLKDKVKVGLEIVGGIAGTAAVAYGVYRLTGGKQLETGGSGEAVPMLVQTDDLELAESLADDENVTVEYVEVETEE